MCINIDIVLHHATIKRYFDSFLTRRATLGCVGQKFVRPPPQFFLTGMPMYMVEVTNLLVKAGYIREHVCNIQKSLEYFQVQ